MAQGSGWAVGAFCAALAVPVGAEQGARGAQLEAVQLQWENDSFLPGDGSDSQYTNGIRLSWAWNPDRRPVPARLVRWLERWCGLSSCGGGEAEHRWGGALVHSLYTPERIGEPANQPNDRPWAGHVFVSTVATTGYETARGRPAQHLFDLQLGLVGPGAGGKGLQTWWHGLDFISEDEPLGWSNQLRNEPTLNLDYRWRSRRGGEFLDLVPSLGFGLGNVALYGSAGATLRAGWGLDPFPQLALPATARDHGGRSWQAYVFVGAEGRWVVHNLFLDGSLFRDGQLNNADPKFLVYDAKFGAVLAFQGLRAEATWTRRSPEFTAPIRRFQEREQEFLSLAVTWRRWRR